MTPEQQEVHGLGHTETKAVYGIGKSLQDGQGFQDGNT